MAVLSGTGTPFSLLPFMPHNAVRFKKKCLEAGAGALGCAAGIGGGQPRHSSNYRQYAARSTHTEAHTHFNLLIDLSSLSRYISYSKVIYFLVQIVSQYNYVQVYSILISV